MVCLPGIELCKTRNHTGKIIGRVVSKHDFARNVIDLGSGTGNLSRSLRVKHANSEVDNVVKRVDPSAHMASICQKQGRYSKIHIGTIQHVLPTLEDTDHIVLFSVLYFLSVEEVSFDLPVIPHH
jgi:predicted TPR repeat methyltransferase